MPLQREWVTIVDPDDDHLHYTFDVSFLLSNYTCIYGAGCQGVDTKGADESLGCCKHGAYLTEDDEAEQIEKSFELLDANTMQFYNKAKKKGLFEEDEEGETHTRRHKGACIFLNRADFKGPMGCVFHHLAERRGEHHMTHKPIVCWQVPLHRATEEKVANDGKTLNVHTIAAYERGTWGDGGADFHWWCTEEPAAFVGADPVYRSMEHELRDMVGDDVYDELAEYLDDLGTPRVQFLPVV